MSNKVIIDGCNVAGCKHHLSTDYCEIQLIFQNNNFKLPYGKHLECYLCKNCYFKQLQRAKEELEQYKKSKQASYETMQKEWNNAVNELRDLKATDKIEFKQYYKAENERLKTENSKLKNRNQQMSGCITENEKYKQALEKIKNNCVEILATIVEEGPLSNK